MPEQTPNPDNVLMTQTEKEAGSVFPNLSNRELEIMRLFAQGMSNKEMSRELMVSETAVRLHIKAIMRKLHLSSRSQIVALLSKAGVVDGRLLGMGPQQEATQDDFETRELDDILLRLDAGITQERSAMSVLLSKLRMTVIAS